jgi:hypothetical protein
MMLLGGLYSYREKKSGNFATRSQYLGMYVRRGLKRWFSPRGQDLAFLLSCIGLVRPSSGVDLKQNKTNHVDRYMLER